MFDRDVSFRSNGSYSVCVNLNEKQVIVLVYHGVLSSTLVFLGIYVKWRERYVLISELNSDGIKCDN